MLQANWDCRGCQFFSEGRSYWLLESCYRSCQMTSLCDLLNRSALCREEAFTSFTQVKVQIHQYKVPRLLNVNVNVLYQPIVLL